MITANEDEGLGWPSVDVGEITVEANKLVDSEVTTLDAKVREVVLLSPELG